MQTRNQCLCAWFHMYTRRYRFRWEVGMSIEYILQRHEIICTRVLYPPELPLSWLPLLFSIPILTSILILRTSQYQAISLCNGYIHHQLPRGLAICPRLCNPPTAPLLPSSLLSNFAKTGSPTSNTPIPTTLPIRLCTRRNIVSTLQLPRRSTLDATKLLRNFGGQPDE